LSSKLARKEQILAVTRREKNRFEQQPGAKRTDLSSNLAQKEQI